MEREREKKEAKVTNLIRTWITSTRGPVDRRADRSFPSGQLYARTIIGVWDPGVPLSVFSAPLDGGTPHCNLSELQFALLCSVATCGCHRTHTLEHPPATGIPSDPLVNARYTIRAVPSSTVTFLLRSKVE